MQMKTYVAKKEHNSRTTKWALENNQLKLSFSFFDTVYSLQICQIDRTVVMAVSLEILKYVIK